MDNEHYSEQLPPQAVSKLYDLEIEQALLGSLLIAPENVMDLDVEQGDFYAPFHHEVYEKIRDIYTEKGEFSLLLLNDAAFKNPEDAEKVGGVKSYLQACAEAAITTVNNQSYLSELKEMRPKRS